jgi:acetyl esterase/lipase
VPNALLTPFATWTYDQNYTAWNAVLDGKQGSETVSPIAAPARLADFAGLAAAYIEVGNLDIFRDEDIAYAQQLARAGVPVELEGGQTSDERSHTRHPVALGRNPILRVSSVALRGTVRA